MWRRKAFEMPDKTYYSGAQILQSVDVVSPMMNAQIKFLLKTRQSSYADDTNFFVPAPKGLEYRPFQNAGIEYLYKHKKCLLGDDQGLGKTIQICGLINKLFVAREWDNTGFARVLIICPASLKDNWKNELEKWLTYKAATYQIVQGRTDTITGADITIINYDVANNHKVALKKLNCRLIAIDECQYLKNHEAARTMAILGPGGIARKAERVVAMSGTPMSNRPIELWPIMATLFKDYVPDDFINRDKFGRTFCDGFMEHIKTYDPQKGYSVAKDVLNVRGASNLQLLNDLLRERFMIRRTKAQVLPQLPQKVYNVIDISANTKQKKVLKKEDHYKEAVVKSIETGQRLPELEEMSSVRKEIALMKVDFALEYILNILDTQDKVIVFCHHSEVVEELRHALEAGTYGVSCITGKTPVKKRQDQVDAFQNGPNQVFIGNLQAAGTGLTLTAASEVVFVECSWVPGENEQAVDRAHRISQLKQVSAHFLVWFGSLDAQILKTSINKQRNIDKVMR